MIRYFAYGSNLWLDQMIARLGPFPIDAEAPRIARLSGYRLAFNLRGENGFFYANLVQPGEYVLGVIYACEPEALAKMDGFEIGYDRRSVEVIDEKGETVEVFAYFAKPENVIEGGKPSDEYVQRILRGAREHQFPEAYLQMIETLAGNR